MVERSEGRSVPESQAAIVALLSDPATHGPDTGDVERRSTHVSELFLTTRHAYKLKKAVRLPFLDFRTPAARSAACRRELEINRATAPALYEGLVPVLRTTDGSLSLGAALETPGPVLPEADARGAAVVEWLVRMRRFDDAGLLDRLACAGGIDDGLATRTADAIWRLHAAAPVRAGPGAAAALHAVAEENAAELRGFAKALGGERVRDVLAAIAASTGRHRDRLEQRGLAGRVRHGHGDLHLRNIVRIDGAPVLFDALEFDEALATTDTGYDLAFLLMDLLHRGLRRPANIVLNRYLGRSGDVGLLAVLPLFLAVRACVRAKIHAGLGEAREAGAYLDLAAAVLEPAPPAHLIAIGGPSGGGKSTLAAALAPERPGPLGAAWLRSDLIRKRLEGVEPEIRLPQAHYTKAASDAVYATMFAEAGEALDAGVDVVLDAVFGRHREQADAADLAEAAGASFCGFWLEHERHELERRVRERRGDPSDAGEAVVALQWRQLQVPADWHRLAGDDAVLSRARAILEKSNPAS